MTPLTQDPPAAPELFERLLKIAEASGFSDRVQMIEALETAAHLQQSLVRTLLDLPQFPEREFLHQLAAAFHLRWVEAGAAFRSDGEFPARLALRYQVLPLEAEGDERVLATYDPLDLLARSVIQQHFVNYRVRLVVSSRKFILGALRECYGIGAETFEALLEGREEQGMDASAAPEVNILDGEDAEASVMKFVNQIIREALVEHATDIHIEPLGTDLRIRYRIDGVLHETPVPANIKLLQASVLSRVKIMANLDIAEKRIPQDGRISLELGGKPIDVRVATIPSVTGETISLRLLGQERFDFSRLGLDPHSETLIRGLLAMPNGIVLVTGPTGCGKSTSLYTFLSSLNTKERRIVTIEDPVEHKLSGVIQIAVRPEINLTFANALRSVLRGDPNVIMVGEMRDLETAEIAVRAALTGHLVFSTLHTNDSVGGITRLMDMGVEPFLIGSSVRAFIAQRLVRRLCPECKRPADFSADKLREIGFPQGASPRIFAPQGCDACRQTGYRGRTALYEICAMTPNLEELVQHKASGKRLRAEAMAEGMLPLRDYGWQRVREGTTSIEEVLRVTAAEVGGGE